MTYLTCPRCPGVFWPVSAVLALVRHLRQCHPETPEKTIWNLKHGPVEGVALDPFPCPHPKKLAKGLCQTCYYRENRRRRKELDREPLALP